MSSRFRIDDWVAAPDLNVFTRADRVVRVEPKVMELCVRLARSPGTVVTKAELLDSVWADAVVGEDALTRAMSELRRALDDDARNPRVIETISKRGYRLIAPVAELTEPLPEPPRQSPRLTFIRSTALVAGALVGLVAVVWWARSGESSAERSSALNRPAFVLVAELENAAEQPDLAAAMRRIVEEELGRSGRLAPMPAQRAADVLARMRKHAGAAVDHDTAREIVARDADVAGFVTGRVGRTGDELALSLQLWSSDGYPLGRMVVRGATEAAVARAIADRSSSFGDFARAVPVVRRPLPPVTTSSLAALRLFAQAVEIADANYASITGPWDTAVELLREAVALDPDFAMARVWLAMVLQTADLGRLSYIGGDPKPTFQTLAEESVRNVAGLPEPERLFVEGAAARMLGRLDQALAALEALAWTDSGLFELRTRHLLADLYYRKARWPDYVAQAVELARLLPDDFDANVYAAQGLVLLDRNTSRAGPYASRARGLLTSALTQRENSCWQAAWIEHLPVFESWEAGDLPSARVAQQAIAASLPDQVSYLRDALATTSGHFSLTLGRISEARRAFELVGHLGQRELNLAALADLIDDRKQMIAHLQAMGWAHSAAIFARAGLLDRANAILRQQTGTEPERLMVGGLEAVAGGRISAGVSLLQQAVDLWRGDPNARFYNASLALADAWAVADQPLQVVRVLEEAAVERPAYTPPGFQAAWWIKVKVRLVREYRSLGRLSEAAALEQQVRGLLSEADPDHPFLMAMAGPETPARGPAPRR